MTIWATYIGRGSRQTSARQGWGKSLVCAGEIVDVGRPEAADVEGASAPDQVIGLPGFPVQRETRRR